MARPWERYQAAGASDVPSAQKGPWQKYETPEKPGVTAKGVGEAALTMATGAIAEPLAGLAGIGAAIIPGGRTGAQAVNDTREALTYTPRTPEGQQALSSVAETFEPLTNALQSAERVAGDAGYAIAGPVGGAIGTAIPTAVGEALGLKAARTASRVTKAPIAEAPAAVIAAGREMGVPVLTTDVIQPDSFIGRFAQSVSEKMGPLGSGAARATQQKNRQALVEGIADQFEIDMDADFASQMVRSINERSAEVLKDASAQRKRAVDSLVRFGEVPLHRTMNTIGEQITRQQRLGAKADTALLSNLQKIQNAIRGGDFALVKDIRTEVISDLRAISRSDDTRAAASLQEVKSAIDQDMMQFARAHDRDAARDWIRSNRKFAHELSTARDTELRNVFNRGDATPEVVMPILRNGKRSELLRLKNSLTVNGKAAARSAILQDALRESGFFTGNVNPDRFVNALQRPNRQQAINVFFTEADGKQMDGLTRLLDATRRAQQAAANPNTGMQTIPFLAAGGLGAGLQTAPLTTLFTAGTLAAFAKAYESRPIRTLLLKIANSKPGSRAETSALEVAVPAMTAALQAAKAQSEQREEGEAP